MQWSIEVISELFEGFNETINEIATYFIASEKV